MLNFLLLNSSGTILQSKLIQLLYLRIKFVILVLSLLKLIKCSQKRSMIMNIHAQTNHNNHQPYRS